MLFTSTSGQHSHHLSSWRSNLLPVMEECLLGGSSLSLFRLTDFRSSRSYDSPRALLPRTQGVVGVSQNSLVVTRTIVVCCSTRAVHEQTMRV